MVVLGHSGCGAITATIENLKDPASSHSRNLRSIVDRVRPSVEPLVGEGSSEEGGALVDAAVRANIRAAAEHLRRGSEILERRVALRMLLVVGAEYSLETGVVDFFDGVPNLRSDP